MPRVVHYINPAVGHHACGMGNPATIDTTIDIAQATCQRCLGTITGRKNSNAQKSDRPKIQRTMRLSSESWEKLEAKAKQDRLSKTDALELAIEAWSLLQ